LSVFSQQGTGKIYLQSNVAKQVALDLTRCDSIKDELRHTSFLLFLYKQKAFKQDTLLSFYRNRKQTSDSIIGVYHFQTQQYISLNKQLTNEKNQLADKVSTQRTTIGLLGGGFIVTLGVLLGIIIK
jgi:hypothetical protein